MDLRPGLVIRALPRFSGGTLDSSTIEVNSGVIMKDNALWPKGDWRALSVHEAEVLGLKADGGQFKNECSQNPDTLWIFTIPLHLLQHWQRISGQFAPDTGACSMVEDGQYWGFVSQVVDFFRFKAVPLPNKCKFEIVSNFSEIGPGRDVPPSEKRDSRSAVQVSLVVPAEVQVAVNLGGAASSLIFVNLSNGQMESILGERGDMTRVRGRSKVEEFFSCFPEYPCFRISLPPRMGYVLGGLAILHVRCSISRAQPDLWLCVSAVSA